MVRRDGQRIRCFTRNGHDWADQFPAIVGAARRLKAASVLIDGEAVIIGDDGTADFHALRSQGRGSDAVLFAFDLLELHGDDLRALPLIERKRRLLQLIGKAQWRAIRFNEHLTGAGRRSSSTSARWRWKGSCPSGS
jgi:bifunctional non-homologous end joining protein LigD